MTGTHKINMVQPDPDLHARLLSVGGTRCAGGNVLHMFGGNSSTWESGSHRVQSFLRPHRPLTASRFAGEKKIRGDNSVGESTWKLSTPPEPAGVLRHTLHVAHLHKSRNYLFRNPHRQTCHTHTPPRLGSFCQKTRRAPTVLTSREAAGALSPQMSSILSDSGPSRLRAH